MDNISLKIQIWDTAGEEHFKSITRSYYTGDVGVLFVYDITIKIVKNLKNWLIDIKDNTMQDSIIILIGNKCDLENNRIVSYNEGFKFVEE